MRSAQAVDLPLLRKDFIVDPYQLWEARAAGADCVLLIAECLTPSESGQLHEQALALGMQTLIELYEPENLDAVLATGTRLVGINNRNLKTFVTDLEHTIRSATRNSRPIGWWSAKVAFAATKTCNDWRPPASKGCWWANH